LPLQRQRHGGRGGGKCRLTLAIHSRILEIYWENSNLQNSSDNLKFLSQVNMAMVINGEFLVSVISGWTAGSLVWRRVPQTSSSRLAVGRLLGAHKESPRH
jgi:hypothetical protein